jgi:hypothetical protein
VDNFFPVIQKINYWGKEKKRRKKSEINYWGLSDKKSVPFRKTILGYKKKSVVPPVRYYWGVIRFYPRKLFLDDEVQWSLLCNTQ